MSLIKCNECGKEISDKASACPGCGCPVEAQNESLNNEAQSESLNEVNEELKKNVTELLKNNDRIKAIQLVREKTGMDLRPAKDVVDKIKTDSQETTSNYTALVIVCIGIAIFIWFKFFKTDTPTPPPLVKKSVSKKAPLKALVKVEIEKKKIPLIASVSANKVLIFIDNKNDYAWTYKRGGIKLTIDSKYFYTFGGTISPDGSPAAQLKNFKTKSGHYYNPRKKPMTLKISCEQGTGVFKIKKSKIGAANIRY